VYFMDVTYGYVCVVVVCPPPGHNLRPTSSSSSTGRRRPLGPAPYPRTTHPHLTTHLTQQHKIEGQAETRDRLVNRMMLKLR
jgi:hypothetical protein